MECACQLVGIFHPAENRGNWTVQDDCNTLVKKWEDIVQFLKYKFSEKHLAVDSDTKIHCCCFAVNKTSACTDHNHNDTNCKSCIDALNAASKFVTLLDYVFVKLNTPQKISSNLLNEESKLELESMKKVAPIVMDHTIHYMGHRLRAKVQFTAI
jgi:hypothetical protein